MSEEEEVKLVFPKPSREAKSAMIESRDAYGRVLEGERVFNVEKILEWFKKLEVKEIELWMETAVKTGKLIQLVVSAEGKGGVKVTLVPKSK